MVKEDFFTGEPVNDGSPNLLTEKEAVQNASFGAYNYDPSLRNMQFQQQQNYGYGYGIGYCAPNPYRPNIYYNNFNPYYQQQYQEQPTMRFIEPINLSGNQYLPSPDAIQKIEDLKMKCWVESTEEEGRRMVDGYGNINTYNYGVNYYNMPYYNYNNSRYSYKIQDEANKLLEEAKLQRKNLNIQLSKAAHNYVDSNPDYDQIESLYNGRYIEENESSFIPTVKEYTDFYRFNNLVPFDNSYIYNQHSKQISDEFKKYVSDDNKLEGINILEKEYKLQEEKIRRKNVSYMYDETAYKNFVKSKAAERYSQQKGYSQNNTYYSPQQQFPTLSEVAKLSDDGTLNITCPWGSKAGQTYSVNNEEAKYLQNKENFKRFTETISDTFYLDSPNAD